MINVSDYVSIKHSDLLHIPFIPKSQKRDPQGFLKYQIAKWICQITQNSPEGSKTLVKHMNYQSFKEFSKQKEYNFIIIQILPSLCLSKEFVKNSSKKRLLKFIFEQVESKDEERIMIGLKCLESLNSNHRKVIHSEVKTLLK